MNSKAKADRADAELMAAYRQSLIDAEKQGQESFDKTVLSLSGGALAISFVFIKDVIGPHPIVLPQLLLSAWVCWALSTLSILVSFYTSNRALRKAIEQCDNGTIRRAPIDTPDCEPPGGYFAKVTKHLNLAGIILLVLGIAVMSAFVYVNLLQRELKDEPNQAVPTQPTTTSYTTLNSAPIAHATRKSDTRQGLRAAASASNS